VNNTDVQVLTLPGYDNSGPEHWHSHWERSRGFLRVEQDGWLEPRVDTWGARLEALLEGQSKPVVLLPHSAACAVVAIWAGQSALVGRVVGTFFVAPADTEKADMLPVVAALGPMHTVRLPFKSLLVASTNDPYCALPRAETCAHDWGSELRVMEDAGHINTASGHGAWAQGLRWLEEWMATL
jgi:hypothetical protein